MSAMSPMLVQPARYNLPANLPANSVPASPSPRHSHRASQPDKPRLDGLSFRRRQEKKSLFFPLALAVRIALLAGIGFWTACGPSFPPYWQISAEPVDSGGNIEPGSSDDKSGALRVLAVVASPPEIRQGEHSIVTSLVVTHPRFAETTRESEQTVLTLKPRGLSVLYRTCVQDEALTTPLPCGVFPETSQFVDLDNRTDEKTALGIPAARVFADARRNPPYVLIVTLFAADAAFEGGASGCAQAVANNSGVSPHPAHCAVATKRVKVNPTDSPNRNPQLVRLSMSAFDGTFADLTLPNATYPKLSADTPEEDRPELQILFERAPDSEEQEPDPRNPEQTRPELLTVTLFVTSGTLETGRANFLDLDCETDCPQKNTTTLPWKPPAARVALEAPDDKTHFLAVLRDDRGGASFLMGRAKAQ